jgi:hypothetical protein
VGSEQGSDTAHFREVEWDQVYMRVVCMQAARCKLTALKTTVGASFGIYGNQMTRSIIQP